MSKCRRPRRDSQKSGLAGELFVAAELLKREYQVSITFGNAKAVDLFVQKPGGSRPITVQVKTLRTSNCYLMRSVNVNPEQMYVFVLLGRVEQPVRYFVVSGKELLKKRYDVWGPDAGESKMAGITMGPIEQFENKWEEFGKLS